MTVFNLCYFLIGSIYKCRHIRVRASTYKFWRDTNIHFITLSFKLFPPRKNWSDPFKIQDRSQHPPLKSIQGLPICPRKSQSTYYDIWGPTPSVLLLCQPHLLQTCPTSVRLSHHSALPSSNIAGTLLFAGFAPSAPHLELPPRLVTGVPLPSWLFFLTYHPPS